MAINLQKGQKIDLTKGNEGLSQILVGLGWDPVQKKKSGFLGGMLGGSKTENVDCDSSVFMVNNEGKLKDKSDIIYFGNLRSNCGGVIHCGDNLTGDGNGDDEQIIIDLKKVRPDVDKLIFAVNIYNCINRNQDFGMIQNAFIRVVNGKDNSELLKYSLTDNYSGKTGLMVAEIYRHNGEWKFAAVGEGTNDTSISSMVDKLK